MSPLLKKESSPRLKTTIRPSGDRLGAVAESVKFVSCVYSDGDVTGTAGFTRGNSTAARVATTAAAIAAIRHGFDPRCAWSSTSRASAMFCTRSVRSLCKQWRKSSRSRAGVEEGNAFQSGSRSRMAAKVSATVCPVKGGRPVSISYRTQPKDQMSARVSTGRPRACSGLM